MDMGNADIDFDRHSISQRIATASGVLHSEYYVARIFDLIRRYSGFDNDAVNILFYSAQKGGLERYIRKLEKFYSSTLWKIPPHKRGIGLIAKIDEDIFEKFSTPWFLNVGEFFTDCYRDLGINPSNLIE